MKSMLYDIFEKEEASIFAKIMNANNRTVGSKVYARLKSAEDGVDPFCFFIKLYIRQELGIDNEDY